ncbi:hypothetical protein [Hymenobacter cellulosivorans]|uniref:DUF4138 domain-containing protein n=1 Tax=Hymenobacter cellulosivorans TaxID=2932249 RepID=A0ABY4F3J2_9BACT|nr:hypothetical protein [Hymenobacter cellulosivorans]UOQ51049.1 hypothetical protein MUN80_14910 [Hymenobacter cellulosivorans]
MLVNPLRVGPRTLFTALLLLCCSFAQAQHPHSPAPGPADRSSTHGMLIFGQQQVFASHLPMFHTPHDYQVVLELELGDSAQAAYRASQQQFPQQTVYTLEPEQFVLPQMVQQPRPFRATLYRGHFERGGTPIARQITVRIRQVLYFQRLTPSATPEPALLLVGQEPEQFVIHRIAGQPDFDQVVQLAATRAAVKGQPEALVQILFTQAAKVPLQAGQQLLARPATGGELRPLQVSYSLYLEHDDLR